MNTTDLDDPYEDAGTGLLSETSKSAARRLRRTRQRLGSYRHDLLVAMRIVNSIEKEMLQSEWENWLADEVVRCDQAKAMLADAKGKKGAAGQGAKGGNRAQKSTRRLDDKNVESLRQWQEEYCGSCRADWGELERVVARIS